MIDLMRNKAAKYASLMKKKVDIVYRDGDIRLRATGMLVADSGCSIFIEEQFPGAANARTFRWEIPYQCIVRLNESNLDPTAPLSSPPVTL